MTIPRHFTSEPRRSIHRLDCHLVGADQILGVARKGEVLRFAVRPEHIHLFDDETGRRL